MLLKQQSSRGMNNSDNDEAIVIFAESSAFIYQ